MLIKKADDKSKRITLLESLGDAPALTPDQRTWARKELTALRHGVQGERDAAHYIDNHFADARYHAVIHDLRLEVDGEVAQIDHLIIARAFTFYLLETKNFGASVSINELGEFSVRYGSGKTYGIPSPIEQSRRHENVLVKLLDRLGIAGRTQRRPDFRHVVLIHPRGEIRRPTAEKFDTSNVIKADQFASWRENFVEHGVSTLQVMGSMLNMRSTDTVREWAEKIARQHRPADLLALPEHMRVLPMQTASAHPAQLNARPVTMPPAAAIEPADPMPAKRLVCATCGSKISYAEGKFCWSNPRRFGGGQYCREHQAAFQRV
ncbi:NERD nuclease [Melaminivora suipulveris]|uniref:NERD nuclease n=1 Tax=Melaminivora suipulveris TaxID=2109913 RepID=A0A2R3Q9V6_9BURK|nr:nuclease-related domain-containing protein [Melaminivora suipulveris]AVO48566.1 NERD nuclease [Melaminivora suipulveris]